MNAKWITTNNPTLDLGIPTLDRTDKIKLMIHRCLDLDMEIPKEWIEEYSELIKEE